MTSPRRRENEDGAEGADERRSRGAYYTSEASVLKVIGPLILDDLHSEFAQASALEGEHRCSALRALHRKIGALNLLDPACGDGSFLVVALRHLKAMERDILKALRNAMRQGGGVKAAALQPIVNAGQLHGIEIEKAPAQAAAAGLLEADRRINRLLPDGLPAPKELPPNIQCADALEIEWDDILPAGRCSAVLGNPPFKGYNSQSKKQSEQMRRIAQACGRSSKQLDLAAGWLIKGGDYARRGGASVGFITVNSMVQGMQPAILWPLVLDRNNLEITAAHQSFPWDGDAAVHVVTVQLEAKGRRRDKRLFTWEANGHVERRVTAISSYLTDGSGLANPAVAVRRAAAPRNGLPSIRMGIRPIDGGHLILSDSEHGALVDACPKAGDFCRPYISAQDFLHGGQRHILWMENAPPEVLEAPAVKRRRERLREYRLESHDRRIVDLADEPMPIIPTAVPASPFLAIPKVSSEGRQYVPMGYMEPPVVPTGNIYMVPDADKPVFALLHSRMHNAWIKGVAGRLQSRISYSTDLCYNAFPTPPGGRGAWAPLDKYEDLVLNARAEARAKDASVTLAGMYDPTAMPPSLRQAHEALDRAVDRLYRKEPFASDGDRLGHLLAAYEGNCLIAGISQRSM